ncbi:MAG: double-strand break repair protein AddB [Rhodospirillaceae bacterium]|nr:double-strand break repair protein AddB [Rhodospirillaceae bacterium]
MPKARIYNICAGLPFADVLAAGLWAQAGQDPLRLMRGIVLVPHRRAVRVIADAFLRLGEGRAMLLPEIRAIGDVEDDEPFVTNDLAVDHAMVDDCPPAIPDLRRQLLLTRLVMRYLERASDDRPGGRSAPGQAAGLAAELARLLDQMQTEGVGFECLEALVPEVYAEHWRTTLEFLSVVTDSWSQILRDEGAVDLVERRNRMLDGLAKRWTCKSPSRPVTIAGSTGSVPATAELMRVVARITNGAVVLPGLDTEVDEATWSLIESDTTHPQHALAILLRTMSVPRSCVMNWGGQRLTKRRECRFRLLNEAMRPASATARWSKLERALFDPGCGEGPTDGMTLIECDDPQEEAGVIALLLREALEKETGTAALVTPDRALARRVKSELRRWGVEIDDSGGQPLGDTPAFTFWRLVGNMMTEGLAPVPLLAALKHPLATGGLEAGVFRRNVRQLELLVLRGPRPAPGITGLLSALRQAGRVWKSESREDDVFGPNFDGLITWLERLAPALRDFERAIASDAVSFSELLLVHNRLVELLGAAPDDGLRVFDVWSGEAGERAADFLADLFSVAHDWPKMSGRDYMTLFDSLLLGQVFRPSHGLHPRLAILGPLEARLHLHDRVVLGGLNEGTRPPEPATDPWLSRPMRAKIGLSLPEARIGQSSHDFIQACGASQIFLTRSRRVDGAPTVPSRWLLRINSVLGAIDMDGVLNDGGLGSAAVWRGWRAQLDATEGMARLGPPAPRPALKARPRSFSVTQIGTWLRNPYAIYAQHILNLRSLDPIDAEPGVADLGKFVHAALDAFLRDGPVVKRKEAIALLLEHGRRVFADALDRPGVWAFWWPRFERIATWFVDTELARATIVAGVHSEIKGEIMVKAPGGPVRLRAIADRVDQTRDGEWTIIDYKTGLVPTRIDIERGLAPQLPLEALVLREGGFSGLPAGRCSVLDYWRLTGGAPAGSRRPYDGDVDTLVTNAEANLLNLLAVFDDPATPYLAVPNPELSPAYNDYEHLARVKEWSL